LPVPWSATQQKRSQDKWLKVSRREKMKLWSKGLGRTEVTMDFRYYKLIKDNKSGDLVVIGNMQDPVTWEFTMKLEPDDIAGLLKLLFNFSLIWYVIKNLFRYPLYLINRKKYVPAGHEKLEEHVMDSYTKSMSRKPRKSRAASRRANTAHKGQEEFQAA